MQFEGRETVESEVADLPVLILAFLDGKGGGLEVEGQVEGVAEFCVVEPIHLSTAVLTISDDVLALTHQTHVELYERLEFK